MLTKNDLLLMLNESKISYKNHHHEPLFTVEDSIKKRGLIDGAHSKNLFLKNKKKEFFLFSCLENTKVELKKIGKCLKLGSLSFANEVILKEKLGVLPGSVTPFGLLNDKENSTNLYLDSGFFSYQKANFHPLINTYTISLDINDLKSFLTAKNKKVYIFDFKNYSLIDSINI